MRARRVLPFPLCLLCAVLSRFEHLLLNRFYKRKRVASFGNRDLQLIPEPLTGSREVKVVSLNRVAVRERHAAARRMAGIGPISSFEQNGVEHSNLNDFSSHSINFDPITESNSVFAH